MGAHAPIANSGLGLARRTRSCRRRTERPAEAGRSPHENAGVLLLLVSPLLPRAGHKAHLLIGRDRRGVGSKNLQFRFTEMAGPEPDGTGMVGGPLRLPMRSRQAQAKSSRVRI